MGKEQIVVIFSRTKRASDIIIVGGDKGWIKDMLWKLATTSNQWSSMMGNILNTSTINTIESDTNNNTSTVGFPENYPYKLWSAVLPSDSTGYIYILISKNNEDFTYIGETKNLRQRFRQHQSGHGAFGTSNPADKPFYVAAYITGLAHYDTNQRMSLERDWRIHRNNLNDNCVSNIVNCGEQIVSDVNTSAIVLGDPNRLVFVRLVAHDVLVRHQHQRRHHQRAQRWRPRQQNQHNWASFIFIIYHYLILPLFISNRYTK
jgi:hypothetical protein